MKTLFLKCLLPLALLYGCISQQHKKKDTPENAADTVKAVTPVSKVGDDCVFDTSAYKFTSEKLFAYQKNIQFAWNDQDKVALVKLNEQDSLQLHIGGCYEFSWSAIFTTDSAAFNNNGYLLNKAAWLAKTFMGNGFDTKYSDCISNHLFTIDSSQKNVKALTIINKDTVITNKIYDVVLFERSGHRTIINIIGYEN
ncbi:hypothetical protein [Chitinophaga sp. RAB17]|uniref:hypothetical protein n=1 Tax=Chitinophaga sp. RAB17 TaxID=3233049 RepID=UPI003F8F1AAC